MNRTLLFLFLLLILNSCVTKNEEILPNIVLFMTDDVGFEHLSCYDGKIPTPNIDKIAKRGMVFNQAYTTAAACTPSRFSIMTGLYPGRCSSDEFLNNNPIDQPYVISWNTPINEKNQTLHKILNDAGYFTGYVGKFHIGDLHFEQQEINKLLPKIDENILPDSDLADSLLAEHQKVVSNEVKRLTGAKFAASILWANSETIPLKSIRKHNIEWITEGGIKFLESVKKDEPFFLHFNTTTLHGPNHYNDLKSDPHFTAEGTLEHPYEHHPIRQTIFNRLDSLGIDHGEEIPDHINHYNAGILYLDDQVGAIMAKLQELGLDENTLVIITADHNVEPGKSTVYNKGIHVPFVVQWPKVINGNTINNELISFVDFLPTFAELAGIGLQNETGGRSFVKSLKGEENDSRKYIYAEEGYTRGISDGKYKYIAMRFPKAKVEALKSGRMNAITHLGGEIHGFGYIAAEYHPGYFDADQLYDLENDPFEQNNLANNPDYTIIYKRMKDALLKQLDSFDHPFDLNDTAYEQTDAFQAAANKVRERGSDFIPWWKRKLEYPPVNRNR